MNDVLPEREIDTHKRATGVLVVVAGSRRMTGAARLVATSAGRIGAGLVQVAVPEGILPIVQAGLVETTFLPLPETPAGTVAMSALGPLLELLDGADALAIGPGLSTHDETADLVRRLVRDCPVPLVLDADGLNAFAGRAAEIADRKSDAILTPHVGEFVRLSGVSARALVDDRLAHVRALAERTDAVTLLKGSRTLVTTPDGVVRINPTGWTGPRHRRVGRRADGDHRRAGGSRARSARMRRSPARTSTGSPGSWPAGRRARGRSPATSRDTCLRPCPDRGRTREPGCVPRGSRSTWRRSATTSAC